MIEPTYFETTTFIFKNINPAKKYSQFTYYDLSTDELNVGDCTKDNIIKIGELYYLYAGQISTALTVKIPSKIVLKHGRKIVADKLS